MSYDFIVLSPHFDDAVLSCSGLILQQKSFNKSILILTVFGGIPDKPYSETAQYFHSRWGLDENPVQIRRSEDQLACKLLGVDFLHLDFLDCIYRFDKNGNPLINSHDDLFKVKKNSEPDLLMKLEIKLKELCDSQKVIIPIGLGSHIDHLLCREAAESANLDCFAYYEEYPYWAREDRDHKIIKPIEFSRQPLNLDNNECTRKKSAINCYQHPIKSLFKATKIEESLEPYAKKVCMENYWLRCV
ncbi:MAG: PIG-L family deacetylase [Bdellovibrionales bacterium]|nr:PIG-L family deacetylase [Bdellovibrionales bacterium]